MKLLVFKYNESGWNLNYAQFAEQILLVGQNASGKSKTIKALAKVGALISQKISISEYDGMNVLLAFETKDGGLMYTFTVNKGNVINEELEFTDFKTNEVTVVISRHQSSCILMNESINPPSNKLVVNVRRDTQSYPLMEQLQVWAENVLGFSFNETDMYGDSDNKSWFYGYKNRLNDIVVDMENSEGAKEEFYAMLKEIDYNITEIKALDFASQKKVFVKEFGINRPLFDISMSKGMFRAIFLVAYLLYFKRNKIGQPAMLLVDDLCEGLDYNRSTKLGKLCFGMCQKLGIQLMASSNDSFLMDVVDLKYWNILRRVGSRVEVINANKDPELFEHFEMTGLTNFDLFSSDFITRYRANNVKQ